jgi:chromate reductase
MNSSLTILGIAGSLRTGSFNRLALAAAQKLVPEGAKMDIFDLHEIPIFNQDQEKTPPPPVVEFKKRIRAADAIVFATPEYNYGVPGVLKNAIDWASRPSGESAWDGKPAAILSAASGIMGGVRAHYHLRQSFVYLNMYATNLPEVLIGNAKDKFDANGNYTDEDGKKLITKLLLNLLELMRKLGSK